VYRNFHVLNSFRPCCCITLPRDHHLARSKRSTIQLGKAIWRSGRQGDTLPRKFEPRTTNTMDTISRQTFEMLSQSLFYQCPCYFHSESSPGTKLCSLPLPTTVLRRYRFSCSTTKQKQLSNYRRGGEIAWKLQEN
jgi:hypothetical protein